jgi:hypothetical protein
MPKIRLARYRRTRSRGGDDDIAVTLLARENIRVLLDRSVDTCTQILR